MAARTGGACSAPDDFAGRSWRQASCRAEGLQVSASEQPRPRRRAPRHYRRRHFHEVEAAARAAERIRVAEFAEGMAQRLIDGPSFEADGLYRHHRHEADDAGQRAAMLRAFAGSVCADVCDAERLWPKVVDQELPL